MSRAAFNNYSVLVQIFLLIGADPNASGARSFSSMSSAIVQGNKEIVQILLEHGAKLNYPDIIPNDYPLDMAAFNGKEGIALLLLQKGANPWNPQSKILEFSARNGMIKVLEEISSKNWSKQASESEEIWNNLLFEAILNSISNQARQEKMVSFLLEIGANPNAAIPEHSPLTYAIDNYVEGIADILVEKGTDLNGSAKCRWAPISLAIERGMDKLVCKMVAKKADVKSTGGNGISPLHIAAEKGSIETIKLLLEAGADLSVKDFDGRFPYDYASTDEVRNFLESKGFQYPAEAEGKTQRKPSPASGNFSSTCPLCKGNGICTSCKGKKYSAQSSISLKGVSATLIDCNYCNGSGKCPKCDGSGKI